MGTGFFGGQCVENFLTIREDCPLLILTRAFCVADGYSLTPPQDGTYKTSLVSGCLWIVLEKLTGLIGGKKGNAAGLATLTATATLILVMLILSCVTFTFCPVKCGNSPAWCCGGCSKLYRWC